jgi:hypothetical protein
MVRLLRISDWSARLHAASAAQDWLALDAADRELADLLPVLAARGDWTTAERAALHALDLAHRQARLRCAQACDALQQRLNDVQAHKDGWLAYALSSSSEEARL